MTSFGGEGGGAEGGGGGGWDCEVVAGDWLGGLEGGGGEVVVVEVASVVVSSLVVVLLPGTVDVVTTSSTGMSTISPPSPPPSFSFSSKLSTGSTEFVGASSPSIMSGIGGVSGSLSCSLEVTLMAAVSLSGRSSRNLSISTAFSWSCSSDRGRVISKVKRNSGLQLSLAIL